MYVIINDKPYQTLDLPNLPSKKSKRQNLTFDLDGEFLDNEVSEIIIVKGYKYQWIFKGCILVSNFKDKSKKSWWTNEPFRTKLTISYESRGGSHLEEVVKAEIRDWTISKFLD